MEKTRPLNQLIDRFTPKPYAWTHILLSTEHTMIATYFCSPATTIGNPLEGSIWQDAESRKRWSFRSTALGGAAPSASPWQPRGGAGVPWNCGLSHTSNGKRNGGGRGSVTVTGSDGRSWWSIAPLEKRVRPFRGVPRRYSRSQRKVVTTPSRPRPGPNGDATLRARRGRSAGTAARDRVG